MVNLNAMTYYGHKDQLKADKATKFIGRGSPRSSTHKYRLAFGDLANCGEYTSEDRVFVSAEGNRNGRLNPDFAELAKGVAAKAYFITDNPANANRSYNVGERQVAEFLRSQGYRLVNHVTTYGLWSPYK